MPAALKRKENIFEILKQRDVLVHHPYTNYSTVTDFINAAAEDESTPPLIATAIFIAFYSYSRNGCVASLR